MTFLFTDIEGSTRLWHERPDEMEVALERHDELVRAAIESHDGYVFATGGDGFAAAFASASDAVAAASAAQAGLADGDLIRARMGLHTGVAQLRDGDYFGPAVNRAASPNGTHVMVEAAYVVAPARRRSSPVSDVRL